MESSLLVALSKLSCGSKLIESFFKNEEISQRLKVDLYQKFRGSFTELAQNSVAYFCILAVYPILNIGDKEQLCYELLESMDSWTVHKHAHSLIKALSLDIFKYDSKNWRQVIFRDMKKRELFSSLITEPNDKANKKRKVPDSVLQITKKN